MDVALVLPIVALVCLIGAAFWLWMLVDALRRPAAEWEAAGQNQVVFVVVIAVLGVVGAIVYALVARPRLTAIAGR